MGRGGRTSNPQGDPFFANAPFNTVWQRVHHIAAGLSERDDVVYVDPNCSFLKVFRPGFRSPPAAAPPRLWVYTPPPGLMPRVHLLPPLGYTEFVAAMERADVILTDSGGVQEEAPCLGKPVLVTRETTERPEGVVAGVAELVGTDFERIVTRVVELLDHPTPPRRVFLYGDGHAGERNDQVLARGRSTLLAPNVAA